MGKEIVNDKGEEIHLTVWMSTYLLRIATGLYKKLGIVYPVNQEDCKIIARLLRNYVYYNENEFYDAYNDIPKANEDGIEYLNLVANFFERSEWVHLEKTYREDEIHD